MVALNRISRTLWQKAPDTGRVGVSFGQVRKGDAARPNPDGGVPALQARTTNRPRLPGVVVVLGAKEKTRTIKVQLARRTARLKHRSGTGNMTEKWQKPQGLLHNLGRISQPLALS